VLAISSRLKAFNFSLKQLILALCVILPLLISILLFTEQFFSVGLILGTIFIIAIFHNYKYGLYFVVIGLPLFQSIAMKSDSATSTGINMQYILIPVVFVSWLSEKISKKELSRIKLPFLTLFIIFIGSLLVSLINQIDTVSPKLITHGLVNVYAAVNYLVLFYILVNEDLKSHDVKKIFWGILIISFITAVIGVFEYFTADETLISGSLRATSTFKSYLRTDTKNNPNAFGTYMAFMAVTAILVWNLNNKKHRVFIYVSIAAIILGLLLSFSRSSLLGLMFAILAYTYIRNKKAFILSIIIALIGLVALYFEPTFHRRIESIMTVVSDKQVINMFLTINPQTLDWSYVEYYGIQGYYSDIISGAFRIWAWIEGVQLFFDHPIFGIGFHLNRAFSPWPTAENLYIDFACMTGLLGFVSFLIIQIRFLRDGFQYLKNPQFTNIGIWWLNILAILFVVSQTGSILFDSKLLGIFWILGGLFYNVKLHERNYIHQS